MFKFFGRMEVDLVNWEVLLRHGDVVRDSARRIHGTFTDDAALELLIGLERITAEQQLGWLVKEVQAINDRTSATTIVTKKEERMPRYYFLDTTAKMRGVQGGDNRGCNGGLCCVYSMWFNPRFTCPSTGCTHKHKWYNRMAYYKTCGPPIFPIGVFSKPSRGFARRDDPHDIDGGDCENQGDLPTVSTNAKQSADLRVRRKKRNQTTKTTVQTRTSRRKHHLDRLRKRVGFTGSHWRSTA